MAYHLPFIQPGWSFCSVASQSHLNPHAPGASPSLATTVQDGATNPDGRPRRNWAFLRAKTADA
jgi:hypothetical protein